MAQQIINIGSSPNDRSGTLWRAGGTIINENFTELYDLQGQNNVVYLRSEADLPNQTATTWTMDEDTPYRLAADFSTSLYGISSDGASLSGENLNAFTMSFTGSGAMFRGTNTSFYIHDISIDPGILNPAFEFDATGPGLFRFIASNVTVVSTSVWAKFTDMLTVIITTCGANSANNGIQMFGTAGFVLSISRLGMNSSSASFVGIDLGTAVLPIIEMNNIINTAPVGAVGISGLANSGNVTAGELAMVSNSQFRGGMAGLQNITIDDLRWSFRDNTPISDTQPDALMSFSNNATETVISASSTDGSNAVLIAGTWIEAQASHFSTTAAGRVTFLADRGIKAPVDLSVGLISAGGGAITVKVYFALDGSVIVNSGVDVSISGTVSQNLPIPWKILFLTGGYLEAFVENQTNTTNIIVDHAILRVL